MTIKEVNEKIELEQARYNEAFNRLRQHDKNQTPFNFGDFTYDALMEQCERSMARINVLKSLKDALEATT